ncbi:MAG: tyrosine-type recombinase/integrase [Pseudomonadota bacterium]
MHGTCDDFLAYCAQTRKLSGHTVKAYEIDIRAFLKSLGGEVCATEVDKGDLREFVDSCFSSGLSHATVKRRIACLQSLFRWLEGEGLIESSPFHRLNLKLHLPKRLPRNLSRSELRQLLRVAQRRIGLGPKSSYLTEEFPVITVGNINAVTTLLAVELLLTTGLRASELTNVSLDDLFLADRYIHIRGKGQRERRVFVTDECIQNLLRLYVQIRTVVSPDHTRLLVNSRGRPATPQCVRLWIRDLSSRANLGRRATPHMFRHSAATELIGSGVDIAHVQKLLGHQSISTTQLYTHITNEEVKRRVVKAQVRRRNYG